MIGYQLLNMNETLSREQMTDSFMHYHQSALDSQREEAEINWLFGDPDNTEDTVEDDTFYPMETDYD